MRPTDDDLIDLLRDLVAIDSTNPGLVPGAAGEEALVRFLARRLTAAGLAVDVWEPRPHRPNFVATLPGHGRAAGAAADCRRGVRRGRHEPAAAAPSLMLVSHLDVVGGAPELFTPQVRDGRLYGRGSNDMKAGLAAAVAVAERLAAEAARGRRQVAAARRPARGRLRRRGVGELRRRRPRRALPPRRRDPARAHRPGRHGRTRRLHLVRARKPRRRGGRRRARKGRRRHRPAGARAGGIAALDRELDARPHASYGRGSIHASTIAGGTQLPAYPGLCRLGVERCLIAGESVAQSCAEIEALLAAAHDADPRFAAQQPPGRGSRARIAAPRRSRSCWRSSRRPTAELGHAPLVRGDIGWADSGIFAEAGIPCAQFGPIGDGEHTAGEWVDVGSVKLVARVLEAAARRYCA